jgi:hypothetical protein
MVSRKKPSLKLGAVYALDGRAGVSDFEDRVVAEFLPPVIEDPYEGWVYRRDKAGDLIVPAKFSGQITNILAGLIEDPYETLIANTGGKGVPRNEGWGVDHTVGFQVAGEMRSSGKKPLVSFESRVYVWQPPKIKQRDLEHPLGGYRRMVIRVDEADLALQAFMADVAPLAALEGKAQPLPPAAGSSS